MSLKNFILGLIIVGLLLFSSFLYKGILSFDMNSLSFKKDFPQRTDSDFVLILFLSKKNCADCLKIIDVLNNLRSPFLVVGILPDQEFNKREDIIETMDVRFPIIRTKNYKKYIPLYTPTVFGVSRKGKIFFKIPITPVSFKTFQNYLEDFYKKNSFLIVSDF